MKIRIKIAIITSLVGALILLSTLILADTIILGGFVSIENSRMIKDVERVNDALLEKMQSIDAVTHDYATWDSSYLAITGENTQYGVVDLTGSLQNTKLDFVVLMRNDGEIMFAKDMFSGKEESFDINTANMSVDARLLYSYIKNNYPSIICADDSSHYNGLLQLPFGVALIASRPVLKSDGTGNITGTLIFGKIIDNLLMAKIADQTHLSFSIKSYDAISYEDKLKLNTLFNNDIIANAADVLKNRNNENMIRDISDIYFNSSYTSSSYNLNNGVNYSRVLVQVIAVDEKTISGNVILKDIYRKPVALLEVDESRTIYLEGKNAIKYILQAMLIATVLFIIVGYLLFNKVIMSRLISMEHQMMDIRDKKLTSSRITITGNDELSSFGESVNNALDIIEKTTEEKQAVFDADPDTYFYVDYSWKIKDYKITETSIGLARKKNIDALKNLYLYEFFDAKTMGKLTDARVDSIKKRQSVILDLDVTIDNKKKVFEARVVAVNNNNADNTKMFLILLSDITDRKDFEQQLLSKNKDLEKFNKFAIDRELRMSDLKKEMRDLKNKKEKTDSKGDSDQ